MPSTKTTEAFTARVEVWLGELRMLRMFGLRQEYIRERNIICKRNKELRAGLLAVCKMNFLRAYLKNVEVP